PQIGCPAGRDVWPEVRLSIKAIGHQRVKGEHARKQDARNHEQVNRRRQVSKRDKRTCQNQQVNDSDHDEEFGPGALRVIRARSAAGRVKFGSDSYVTNEIRKPENLFNDTFPDKSTCAHRKMKKVAASGHLRDIGIPLRIVWE